ncbi:hypothetical protein F5H01DRAFT_352171 [Linnemannia elongata]|nr:hypothetical protein F5H01DRAFT_352171 [Linnemannia elongata]
MSSASTLFFETPELLNQLARHLSARNIARIILTDKVMHTRWTSLLYRRLDLAYSDGDKTRLLSSTDAVLALGRSIQHVRDLKMALFDLVYIYNCILDLRLVLSDHSQLPRWLAPPDPRTCQLVPLLPMVNLTRLHLHLEYSKDAQLCPYLLPSSQNPRATITQASWIVQLNPHLLDLKLTALVIKDQQDIRLLTWSIHGLTNLRSLEVEVLIGKEDWFAIGSTLFFSCPSTVQRLSISTAERSCSPRVEDMYSGMRWTESQMQATSKNMSDEVWFTTTPRRQDPLAHLANLTLWDMESASSAQDILAVLSHCQAVEKLKLPKMTSQDLIDVMAAFMADHFSKLRRLHFVSAGSIAGKALPFKVMESMREQRLEEVSGRGSEKALGSSLATTVFQRHSETLRQLTFNGCGSMDSASIRMILGECRALEDLYIHGSEGSCLRLADAVLVDWVVTKIIRLSLTVGFTDLQTLYPDQKPYYRRPAPLKLFAEETQQFELLERFYGKVGKLTQLEMLDLRVQHFHAHGHPLNKPYATVSLPGLLSMPEKRTGRPGYLQLLAGLTKLRELRGSISADTEETKRTVGWREVVFIDNTFSDLRVAEFFSDAGRLGQPFRWLVKQRHHPGSAPLSLVRGS